MRILETVLYVDDLEIAQRFYTGVLGLEEISFDPERDLFLRLEGSVLILFRAAKTRQAGAGVPVHGSEGPGHLAFAATEDELEMWRERLLEFGTEIELERTWWNGAKSIYFRDPAGNSLEFATPRLWGLEESPSF